MSVLLITADPALLELLTATLNSRGHEVTTYSDAAAAAAAWEYGRFHLIVLDWAFGDGGASLLRQIRDVSGGEESEILVLVESATADLTAVLEAGASDYLVKPFTLDTLTARLTFAERHAVLIEERAQLAGRRERERRHVQERDLIDRVRAALARELDLTVLFRTVVEAIAETFGYTQVSIYLFDHDQAELVLQDQVGYHQVLDRIPVGRGIMGRVARTGEPVLLEDVRTDPAFLGAISGIDSEVCVPFFEDGRVAGTLNVESTGGVRLGKDDLRLMMALSEHISLAVGQAQLHATVRASEERLRLALTAAEMGTWDWNVSRGKVIWSAEMGPLYGLPAGTPGLTDAEWFALVHPDDREFVRRADELAVNYGADYEAEFRVITPNGTIRWLAARGQAVAHDADGRAVEIVGVTMDVTARLRVEQERLQLAQAEAARSQAQAAERRITETLESITDAFVAVGSDGRLTFLNQRAAQLFQRPQAALLGRQLWTELPEPLGEEFAQYAQAAIEQRAAVEFDTFFSPLRIWLAVRVYPAPDGLSIYLQDITARKQAERNVHFLVEAGTLLSTSLDAETTLASLARLAVSYLADWCVVDIVGEEGRIEQKAVAHVDPAQEARLVQVRDRLPLDVNAASGPGYVLRTGQAQLVPMVGDDWLLATARDAEHLAILRDLAPRSVICAPIVARGTTLGVVSFASVQTGRYGEEELALTEALARRAALALDNARLYEQAQAAIHARDQFLSIAAHELRTPITAIAGFTQLLQQIQPGNIGDQERVARFLSRIAQGSQRLSILIDDLLDVSRIRLGQLTLRRQRIDLADLVRAVSGRFQEDRHDERHHLTVHAPDMPCMVEADADRLDQVITNLLDNAVKYSPGGGETHLSLEPDTGGTLLTVQDEGIGLPRGEPWAIFEPFGRAANATRENLPGLGLGLYICRNIVERHGGRIWAESAGEGCGTSFYVWLPGVED